MITIKKSEASELDISNGSHMFCRDGDGKEVFKEWAELDEKTHKRLSELAVQAEGIMERAGMLLKV